MKLTTRTRYALRAMVDLANQPEGSKLSLEKLASQQRIAVKYLEQILMKLRHARLVNSKKGPGGGYFLSRDPHTIKLSDILSAVGESTAPVLCAVNQRDKYCSGAVDCPLQPYWQELKEQIDSFFETHTLSELCSKENGQ